MIQRYYSEALFWSLKQNAELDGLLSGLDRVLKRRGHMKLKHLILIELQRMFEREKEQVPRLTVATKADMAKLKDAILTALTALDAKSEAPEVRVQSNIIGGYALEYKGRAVDATYKNRLLTLYRNITQ